MNDQERQLPELLEPLFDDGTITVRQDAEWAVPGFMVVGIRPHVGALDQMDPALATRIMAVTRAVRAGMRQELGVAAVHMYQEEKLDRAHFHVWMLPLWPDVMVKYDINPRIYESNIAEYLSLFDLSRHGDAVRACAARLRSYLSDENAVLLPPAARIQPCV